MDSNYPGIEVEFRPDVEDEYALSNPRVLMERPADEGLRALIWANAHEEDYTTKIKF